MKIYLSGKITGLTREEVVRTFSLGEELIKTLRRDTEVSIFSPVCLEDRIPNGSYEDYMRVCVQELLNADEAYFMKGWETSRGANVELMVANACGIKINFL